MSSNLRINVVFFLKLVTLTNACFQGTNIFLEGLLMSNEKSFLEIKNKKKISEQIHDFMYSPQIKFNMSTDLKFK